MVSFYLSLYYQSQKIDEAERDYALAKILKLGAADTSASAVGSGAVTARTAKANPAK